MFLTTVKLHALTTGYTKKHIKNVIKKIQVFQHK